MTDEEQTLIQQSIIRLSGLLNYPFTALEIGSAVNEEQVSDIFVRLNSAGKPLNQADFILTLMSVFWDEGRSQLEAFSRGTRQPTPGVPGPFNFIRSSATHVTAIGRLSYLMNFGADPSFKCV